MRVATIDSGVNPGHPHVEPIAGGVGITSEGRTGDFLDLLGHGTAVAGAIREKAPDAEIFAVKVFERQLATTGLILLDALDWCLENGIELINLSLGTANPKYTPAFEERIARARGMGSRIVAAYEMGGHPAYPGSLGQVIPVVLDERCPRDRYLETGRGDRLVYAASGYPRDIPGVPPERNLQGISFAVANVCGFLAAGVAPSQVAACSVA